jgi:hypothetical protein
MPVEEQVDTPETPTFEVILLGPSNYALERPVKVRGWRAAGTRRKSLRLRRAGSAPRGPVNADVR